MVKSILFALPPIPDEIYEGLTSGPVIRSSVAEFVFKKKIEPVGEAFFYRYEARELNKINSLKEDIRIEDSIPNNDIYFQDEGKQKFKKTSGNKSGSKFVKGVLSLARLKELVEEKETLYEKLRLDENVCVREIKQAYRKLVLSYHPDKYKESSSDARSEEFLKIQEAYEILSDKNLRHTYDSALPFDDSIPSSYVNENDFHEFKNFFSPIFHRNSRWSVVKPVPEIGNADDNIEVIERFYEFWRGFQSNRDFSIHEEHELNHAECREEKRWMERQNFKIRSKYIRNEISRINKLVDLAYKNDPRIKQHFENLNKRKEEEKRKKLEEKKIEEEKKRLMDEKSKKKAIELKSAIKSLRVSIRNKMKNISDINVFFDKFQKEDFSDCLKTIEDFNWVNDFLKNIHLNELGQTYSIEKINFKQWEEWFLKLNHFQLEQLDNFLNKWIEVFGENCNDDYLKKLYLIFTIKILDINDLDTEKSSEPKNKTDESNIVNNFSNNCVRTFTENLSSEWTVSEMSLLAKALQKYPGGYKNRWDMISKYLNTKTKEQILTKVKELSESEKLAKLSNEVKEESAFDTFIQSNKGVLKKFDNIPDVRDYAETSVINNSANADVVHLKKRTDLWTKDQQCSLEKALKQYPSSLPPNKRWELISSCIPGKDSSQCLARYKLIRERILKKQK